MIQQPEGVKSSRWWYSTIGGRDDLTTKFSDIVMAELAQTDSEQMFDFDILWAIIEGALGLVDAKMGQSMV